MILKKTQESIPTITKLDPKVKYTLADLLYQFTYDKADAIKQVTVAVNDFIKSEIHQLSLPKQPDTSNNTDTDHHRRSQRQKRRYRKHDIQNETKLDRFGRQLYKWPLLNEVIDSYLSTTNIDDDQHALFTAFKELGTQLAKTKQLHSLTQAEIDKLRTILDVTAAGDDTIRSLFPKDSKAERALEATWEARLRLDSVHLKERVLTCKELKDNVEEKLKELTKLAKYKEFKVADIKGLPRALVKLDEYIVKRRKKNLPISSAVQDCKDLLRGSFVTETADETKAVVDALTAENPWFSVYAIKNGFLDKSKKPGDQCDIKVILKTKDALCNDFDELVEVQIIQNKFIEFKITEHKIQDIIREIKTQEETCAANKNLQEQLNRLIESKENSTDAKESSTRIMQSDLKQLSQVKKLIIKKYSIIFEKTLLTVKHKEWVTSATFSPCSQYIVTASEDKTAKVTRLSDSQTMLTVQYEFQVQFAMFSACSQYIVTASWDKTAKVTRLSDSQTMLTIQHEDRVNKAMFSACSQYIVTASWDKTAKVTKISDSQTILTIQHEDQVNSAMFSPCSQYIVTASDDKTAKVTKISDSQTILTVQYEKVVNSAMFSACSQYIVTASSDGTAKVTKISDSQTILTIEHKDGVNYAMFSACSQYIVTASRDGTAKVTKISDSQTILTVGHEKTVNYAMFSACSQYIVTASKDTSAKVTKISDSQTMLTVRHEDQVRTAMFSACSQYIVTASEDGTAKVMDVTEII